MSQKPSTPVKVPPTASSYTPATLDPDLRSQINAVLLRDGHVTKIQESLLHSLNAHQSNWPTAVRTHALALLRSGQATSYPDLLRQVLDDVRSGADLSDGSSKEAGAAAGKKKSAAAAASNGNNNDNGSAASLALPQEVIDEALRVTRESLEVVCEVDDNGSA